MPLIIKRRQNSAILAAVGLVDGYQAARGLPKVCWPHFLPGTKVQLIAQTGAWKYQCKTGDKGVVVKLIQASKPQRNPEDDLYEVKLDSPKCGGKEVVYLTYNELARIGD